MNTLTMVSKRAALLAAKRAISTRVSRIALSRAHKIPYAVESPEGPADLELRDNLDWDEHAVDYELMFGHAKRVKKEHEAAAKLARASPFAIESPDGPSDLELRDNLDWDEQVVDYEMFFGHTKIVKRDRALAAKMMRKAPFAVVSPDGPSDLELKDNLDWDEHAIDYEMMFGYNKQVKKDREEAVKLMRKAPFAVESPEGPDDLELRDNVDWDEQVVDYELFFGHAKKLKEDRAAAAKVLAVDAPDGTTDSEMIDTAEWDAQVIDHEVQSGFAAELKDARESAAKVLAVDAPDGTTDAEVLATRQWDEQVIEHEANLRREARESAARILAVDAPDGTPDSEVLATQQWDEQVIDYAAKHEDTAQVHRLHKLQHDIRKQNARDVERMW